MTSSKITKILSLLFFILIVAGTATAGKKKIRVSTSESDAKIYVDGVMSGMGQVTVVVEKHSCVTVKTEKTGFLEETITFCNRKNAAKLPKSYYIEMRRDDSYDASVQTDIANVDVEIQSSLDYEDAWKILNRIVVGYIDALEITDSETGYIRTSWEVKSFTQNTIRTRVIAKLASEDPLTFKIKLVSEWANGPYTSVKSDELFREWDRVLRRYANLISEAQTRLK